MDDDQQFCLRWNNHQSTLISVFDTLLENETLVDCTLAAEGKFLKAHKVVLSACSPYFATLLQEQYDKHPIFILKDVKYQELRAMMDYMYRGEVNISQDQLAALLKAAESLQIKGLSDNRTGGGSAAAAPKPESSQHHRGGKMSGAYTLEQTKRARLATGGAMDTSGDVSGSREGSSSPSRRRRKVRRRSLENDAHDNSNSSVLQAAASNQSILQQTSAGLAVSALVSTQLSGGGSNAAGTSQVPTQQPLTSTNVTKKTESAKLTSSTAAPAHAATATAAGQQQQQQTSDAINTENVQPQSQGAQGDVGDAEEMEEVSAASGGITPAASGAGASAGVVHTGVVVKQLSAVVDKSSSNHKQKVKDNSVSSVGSEMVIEPKAEYDDDTHDENVEDLTLDEEDMTMEELDQTAGTSQGGEGSSQTYATWQHDRSQDELGLMAQDAQQRDPQDLRTLYCNLATAVVAAASAATKKPVAADCSSGNSNTNHNHINNCHVGGEICEPEVTIRRMYKCGHASQSEAATVNHLQPGGISSNSSNLHCIARNCSSCQMSAFQVASMFKSSMRSAAAITTATTTAAIKPQRNHIAAAVVGIANNNNCATATKKSSIQFHCEFCNFSCTWRYDLKLHLRQKHGIHQLKKV
ncbi:longitudinals lacking protein, isoforms H/M/V isoform X12 [Drosophila obscura]|uniref:longitudinals lacking protein, isoforms H/M/V isoform X12 n=1 Tax=Drosophila obscura TaxID=7282 RepID=UPI001BB14421|nr:longitudinals lacking protein, isoforms H/M/V isoform X12 [Drosophila obscura]